VLPVLSSPKTGVLDHSSHQTASRCSCCDAFCLHLCCQCWVPRKHACSKQQSPNLDACLDQAADVPHMLGSPAKSLLGYKCNRRAGGCTRHALIRLQICCQCWVAHNKLSWLQLTQKSMWVHRPCLAEAADVLHMLGSYKTSFLGYECDRRACGCTGHALIRLQMCCTCWKVAKQVFLTTTVTKEHVVGKAMPDSGCRAAAYAG